MDDIVAIPATSFRMGSDHDEVERTVREWQDRLVDRAYRSVFRDWILKEYPAHRVTVAAFGLARVPVTNRDYRRFLRDRPGSVPESLLRDIPGGHPVWGVSLADAQAYAAWLRRVDGRAWRLPSETEWELAAAGPQGRRYPYGDVFSASQCNSIESRRGMTTPVDAFPGGASDWGVLDLAGNVEEWTMTRYEPYSGGAPVADDLARLHAGAYNVLRGGCFALGGDLTRTRRRHGPYVGAQFAVTGFRLALDDPR